VNILFYLLVGHALADFSLQTEVMAKGKNRHRSPDFPSKFPHWIYWLTAHALIHGGAVAIVTGIWWLGPIETVCHWLIDFGKCEEWYKNHVDQALHIACKLVFWAYVIS